MGMGVRVQLPGIGSLLLHLGSQVQTQMIRLGGKWPFERTFKHWK